MSKKIRQVSPLKNAKHSDGQDGMSKDILKGMATALSIDHWNPPPEAACEYEPDPNLAINFLCMHPRNNKNRNEKDEDIEPPPNKADAARYQEIFVDLVAMECANQDATSPRHILDDRFDSFLPKGERDFKDSLMEFILQQSDDAKQTKAFQYMENMLRTQMGFRNTYFWSNRQYARKNQQEGTSVISSVKKLWSGEKGDAGEQFQFPDQLENNIPLTLGGHVFVCNSSVCNLQCDAFLCPASISFKKGRVSGSIVRQWMQGVLETNQVLRDNIQHPQFNFREYPTRSQITSFRDWPWNHLQSSSTPFIVFGEVTHEEVKQCELPTEAVHIQFLMETVRQFLAVTIDELSDHQPRPHCYRQRYLLALPILGTGGAFAGDLIGQVTKQLFEILVGFVQNKSNVDIVLVCADEATYTHAQTIRYRYMQEHEGKGCQFFDHLDPNQRLAASRLARFASKRQLALFIGAGVSIGSGLPSWFGLLHIIEDAFTPTGAPSEREIGNKTNWDPLAMADELDEWCQKRSDRQGRKISLKERVCEYISNRSSHIGLLLALLISIPCLSIVTQNYDQLIEKACQSWSLASSVMIDDEASSKKRLSVIPYQPQRGHGSKHWLLKMHGCVTAPNEIILTSQDYKGKESRSKTLAGLVQASLMTQHLLFVGFSMSDPNYLTIVDQVRKALRPYGTTA